MEEKKEALPGPSQKEESRPAEWYRQIDFNEAKEIIRENIAAASRSFIAVGYYLKYIRDREMYGEAGCQNIWEFAEVEYGISKSTASRYMTMNDRFSKGGNSPVVAEEYRGYGKSQLQEMLYLTDEQLELVTPESQVRQIRELRQPTREIPYIELPGQLSIEDFPDFMPESRELMEMPKSKITIFTLEDLVENGEIVAKSQQAELEEESGEENPGKMEAIPEPDERWGIKEVPQASQGMSPEMAGKPVRLYCLYDVEQEIELLITDRVDAPITGLTQMRLDAMLLLKRQMEEQNHAGADFTGN